MRSIPVSALITDNNRRGSERYPLPKPVAATYGGFAAKLVEFSLTGCRIEHVDRITPRVSLPLKFSWRGKEVKIQATLVRAEMKPVNGKIGYFSGLEFCQSIDDAPAIARDIVQWFVDAAAAKQEPEPASVVDAAPAPEAVPFLPDDAEVEEVDEEAELLSMPYLQCIFTGREWQKVYVDKPVQPAEGFTIVAPANEKEADVLCRAYEKATPDARRAMRARFAKTV